MLNLWKKILILFIFCITHIRVNSAYTQQTINLSDISNLETSVTLDHDDNKLIKTAMKKVQNLQADIETITKELFELDKKEKEKDPNLSTSYRQARNEIVKVISSIDKASSKISSSLKRLKIYQEQMKTLILGLSEARESAETAKKYLIEYLTLLYKTQLKIYTEDGDSIDDIRLFINSNNFNETFIGSDLLSSMTAQLYDIIDISSKEETKKTNLLSQLWNLKIAAQNSIETYRKEIETLEQKKLYLANFIKLYKDEADNQSRFDAIFNSKEDINIMINWFIDDIIKKNYRQSNDIPNQINEFLSSKDTNYSYTSPIAWPIYPIETFEYLFNDPSFEKEFWFKHQAIKIKATQWTPIYAAKDWIVYFVSNSIDSISWLMIIHKDWYITIYEYLNQILVNSWEKVSRWQLIWYSWWEPWTMGAWFGSEWENLTFQVFKDWIAIDPLTILDLSVVTNWQNILPDEYRLKYLNDQLVRPIDVSNIKIISWDSVDIRAQKFLNSNWVWVYRDLNFWESVVEWTNIDRDVVICIACAESTLWQYLTTSNNIGNVGNNDRWDRVWYSTPYAWARVIPLTLNNQYLWKYRTINQLSRYGNEEWKIYASSPINRQRNVQKCLSMIKWYTVPEDFPFRTGPNPNN